MVFIISAIWIFVFAILSEGTHVDIKNRMKYYNNLFTNNNDYADISNKLEALDRYLQDSITVMQKELDNNKQLQEKIAKYGKFDNNKATFIKGKDKYLDDYIEYLNENGIKIGYSEGNIYLYSDPMYIVAHFKDVLPKNIIEYYVILGKDEKEGFQEDAGLTIPWDLLRSKIIRYENYLNTMRAFDCPYIVKSAKEKIGLYLNAYLKGLDNSRIQDNIQEARISYEKFINENKTSKYYDVIKGYYSELKRNNFKFGQKVEQKGPIKYVGWTILDENKNEIYIDEVADKYLEKANKLN